MEYMRRLFNDPIFRTSIAYILVSLVVFANIIYFKSPIIGFVTSIIFVYISSILCGNFFFEEETFWHKVVSGFAVFVCLLALGGSLALMFYELSSKVVVILLSLMMSALIVLNLKQRGFGRRLVNVQNVSNESSGIEKNPSGSSTFSIERIPQVLYILLLAFSFALLLISRSEETYGVLSFVHPAFLPTLFIATFVLLVVLLSKATSRVKLSLITLHSLLVHSLLVFVLNPGLYGDQWYELGLTRDIVNFNKNLPNFFDFMSLGGARMNIVTILYYTFRKRAYQSLVTIFANTFSTDVYWSHLFLSPVIWSLLIPFITYKILKILGGTEKLSIFSAFLSLSASQLIWWGAITVPDTLSIVFFGVVTYVTLKYLSFDKAKFSSLLLILIAALVSFSAHFKTGILAIAVLLLAFTFKVIKGNKHDTGRSKVVLLILSMLICSSLLPLALFGLYGIYPEAGYMHVRFSVEKLFATDVMTLVFADYVNYSFRDLLISGSLSILGVMGLIYILLYDREGKYNRTMCVFLLAVFIVLNLDYRILKYAMVNVPFGEERIWVFRDLLLIPFAAVIVSFLVKQISLKVPSTLFKVKGHTLSGFRVVMLVCIILTSSLAVKATMDGYIITPAVMNPTPYEIEAIKYIDRNTPETYAVIGDGVFVWLAYGLLGFKAHGYYTRDPFYAMYDQPSTQILTDLMSSTGSSVGYFAISSRYEGFENVARRAREIFDIYAVFGDGKLYIFRYPLAERQNAIPVVVEAGNYSRVNYPVKYEVNFTQVLFSVPGMHLDPNSVYVAAEDGEEVPSELEGFQAWLENCSSTENWKTDEEFSSDGDVITYTVSFTNRTPEIGRLTYAKFERDGGNLTVNTQQYKYLETKWMENYDNRTNIRIDLWYKVGNEVKGETAWGRPSTKWNVWRLALSQGVLYGLWIDVFDAPPGDWVGDYKLYIDWIRFVGDTGAVYWLYNGTANSRKQYRIVYDFLEKTEGDARDGLPKKYNLTFHENETVPPPQVDTLLSVSLKVRTLDLLGQPLDNVEIEVKGFNKTTTDGDGWAYFDVPPGRWTLVASKKGAVNEKSVEALTDFVVLQRLNLAKIGGLTLNLWEFLSFIGLILIVSAALLYVLHRKLLTRITTQP